MDETASETATRPAGTETQSTHTRGRFRAFTVRDLEQLTKRARLTPAERLAVRAVAQVLPFRTNEHVVEELIDWSAAPEDPIYRLVFPQPDMLPQPDVGHIADLLRRGAPRAELDAAARRVRQRLNPHPASQVELNRPVLHGRPLHGMQHKYRETLLYFPRRGQTCHAYCSYCFRWPQFVPEPELKIAADPDVRMLTDYLRAHPEVTNVLFTGGDPLIMSTEVLRRYVEPLLALEQIESVRVGTKALAFWPRRLLTDPDAADLLRLFEQVVAAGKNLAVMAHYSHPRELEPASAQAAIAAVRATGAVIRTQAPLIRTVNDAPQVWSSMWSAQVRHGMVPYYMFVERDTGPADYFAVPLARAHEVFRDAYVSVSGLARTVRGPSMSTTAGKVCVDGVAEVLGRKVFALHMIQARDPSLVGRPFYAEYDPDAVWLSDLRPAFEARFPFDPPETGAQSAPVARSDP